MWHYLSVKSKMIPSHIESDGRVDFLVMFLGGLAALGLHFLFLVLFLFFEVKPLALFNVVSVSLFSFLLIYLYRTGDTLTAVIATAAEVIAHQIAAVYFLGWDCGFQYYLLCVSDFVFLARFRSKVVPALFSAISLLILVWLHFHGGRALGSHYGLPTEVVQGLYLFNLFSAAALLVLFSIVYNRMVSQQEQALLAANRSMHEANQAKSAFLATMSHEFRTPMNAVIGFTDLALRRANTDEHTQRDLIRIQGASRSLLNLINDILDFSKIEAGKLELLPEDFELRDLVERIVEMFGPSTAKKQVELQLDIDPEVPEHVHGDSLRLNQVLTNLLSNAIKFTSAGRVRLRVSPSTKTNCVRFAVSDTGRGIAPDRLERLFDPFTQEDHTIQKEFGGTGLGLSICRQLVELMGGELRAESVLGEGSTFFFELPLPDLEPVRTEGASQPHSRTGLGKCLQGLRLLVADDVELNRELAFEMLEEAGASVTLASGGREAVEKAGKADFDAVLMDVNMPDLDGYESTRLMREAGHRELPIIAMTANALSGDRQRSLEAGLNEHITKPIRLDAIEATLRKLLGDQRFQTPSAQVSSEPAQPVPKRPTLLEGHLDLPSVMRRINGNEDLLYRLLTKFAERYGGSGGTLTEALAANDFQELSDLAHQLKGAASNLSLVTIEADAKILEDRLRESTSGAGLKPLLSQLIDRIETVVEQIKVLNPPERHVSGAASDSLVTSELYELKTLLEQNRLDALNFLQAHEGKARATFEQDFRALQEAITSLRFEEALKVLEPHLS